MRIALLVAATLIPLSASAQPAQPRWDTDSSGTPRLSNDYTAPKKRDPIADALQDSKRRQQQWEAQQRAADDERDKKREATRPHGFRDIPWGTSRAALATRMRGDCAGYGDRPDPTCAGYNLDPLGPVNVTFLFVGDRLEGYMILAPAQQRARFAALLEGRYGPGDFWVWGPQQDPAVVASFSG